MTKEVQGFGVNFVFLVLSEDNLIWWIGYLNSGSDLVYINDGVYCYYFIFSSKDSWSEKKAGENLVDIF